VSFLDRFRKSEAETAPPGQGVGPGGFEATTNPQGARVNYPTLPAHYGGLDGWSPRLGVNSFTLKDQDELLVHYDDEPPTNPTPSDPYWKTRNDSRLRRGAAEKLSATYWDGTSFENTEAPNPVFYGPPKPSRPTAYYSPSNYRFQAPMRSGRGDTPHLTGQHFSMASMHRSYPIRGMTPKQDWRNTFRLEPPPRDAANMDVPAEEANVPAAVYTSPVAGVSGGSFRLV